MCTLCERLQPRWAVCTGCDLEFPYQAADQLADFQTARLDASGQFPWYIDGHVPDWLRPSMVWTGQDAPSHCSKCNAYGWRAVEDWDAEN